MKQIFQKSELQFKQKGERVLCLRHKEPVIQLNIGINQKLDERLICSSCDGLGKSLLSLYQIESFLYEQYKEDQETICKIDENIKLTLSEISEIQQKFENYLHLMLTRINELQEKIMQKIQSLSQFLFNSSKEWNQQIEQNSNTKLQVLITKIQIRIPDPKKKSIQRKNEKLLNQLNSIKVLLENSEKQESGLQKKNNQILEVQKQQQDKLLDYESFKYNDPIQLEGHNNTIGTVAVSNNDQLMASGADDGEIILWDLHSRSIKQKYNGQKFISDLIFSFDDKLLAAAQYYSPFDILIFNLSLISSTSPPIRLKDHSSIIQ